MPEVVVLRDDLGGGHDGGWQVGDVALEPDEGLRAGQAGLVEDAVPGVGLDEAGGFDGVLAVDDLVGAGLLGVEGFLVAACPFGRVGPDGPPGCGVGFGVPDRLGAMGGLVDLVSGVPGVTVSTICPSVNTSSGQ